MTNATSTNRQLRFAPRCAPGNTPIRPLIAAVILGSLLTAGCTTESSGDTDTDTDAGTDASSTGTTLPSTSSSTTPSTTSDPSTSGSSGSSGTTSTTNDTDDGSSSSDGSSSTGEVPAGFCFGVDQVGFGATVHTMKGPAQGACSPDPAPCGGDLLGTWDVVDNCGFDDLPNIFGDTCPDAVQMVTGTTTVGTRTFVDDGTFSFDFLTTIELETTFDAMDCFAATCEAVGAALDAQDGTTALCEEQAAGCLCLLEIDSEGMQAGTYSTNGQDVEFTVEGESTGPQPFCVIDGRFDLWSPIYALTPYEVACELDDDCIDALGNASQFYLCVDPEA